MNNNVRTMLTSEKKGAIYIRVSTHMQEELSPDAQKRLILDYAKANNISVSTEHIYMEGGISGRKADKRPEFQRMIADAKSKEHPFDIILVWKFSRFARNQEESIVYKSLLNKQCKVEVQSVSEPLADGPFGSLIERIIEWMDEYYSIRLSGEVFRGMSEKAMRGGYLARPPLGYRIDKPKEPPVIVPEEAEIVRTIFDWYVNKKRSFFDISRGLNRLGYKTSHGKEFERRSIEYIIQNPAYCGMIRWNRTHNETNEIKPKEEWIISEGQQPPIISKELFDQAQERYRSTYTPKGARPSSTYKHWLSGLVKCPECGRTMIAKFSKGRTKNSIYCYFVCYGYTKGKCLKSHSINANKLEPSVLQAIKETMDTGNLNFEYIEPKDESEELNELEMLRDLLSKISDKEKRIKAAYVGGIDTLEEYKENKELLQKEKESIRKEIAVLETESQNQTGDRTPAMLRRIHSVYDILSSETVSIQDKSDAAKSIVEKIVYNKNTDALDILYYYNP